MSFPYGNLWVVLPNRALTLSIIPPRRISRRVADVLPATQPGRGGEGKGGVRLTSIRSIEPSHLERTNERTKKYPSALSLSLSLRRESGKSGRSLFPVFFRVRRRCTTRLLRKRNLFHCWCRKRGAKLSIERLDTNVGRKSMDGSLFLSFFPFLFFSRMQTAVG